MQGGLPPRSEQPLHFDFVSDRGRNGKGARCSLGFGPRGVWLTAYMLCVRDVLNGRPSGVAVAAVAIARHPGRPRLGWQLEE